MRTGIVSILMLMCVGVYAQSSTGPIVSLDTNLIQTGERAVLTLAFHYRVDEGDVQLIWPQIEDTLARSMEVISKSPIDTSLANPVDDPYLFAQSCQIEITSFDTGYIPILPLKFIFNGDTVESPAILLEVREPVVNPEEDFADIKDIQEVEFTFMDWLRKYQLEILLSLGTLLLLVALYVLLKNRRRSAVEPASQVQPEVQLPAHIWALQELENLRREGLWQQGRIKRYYSGLNTILREYLERRYGIHAMEETSSEIIRELDRIGLDSVWKAKLRSSLSIADLVKFAKEKPLSHENEAAFNAIVEFVKSTAESEEQVKQ